MSKTTVQPKRKSIKRKTTTSMQGSGSFVKVKALSYGTARMAQRMLDDIRAEDRSPTADEDDAYLRILLSEGIVEWNWVDDNDEPLPLPSEVPDDEDFPYQMDEISFLTDLVMEVSGMNKDKSSSSKN